MFFIYINDNKTKISMCLTTNGRIRIKQLKTRSWTPSNVSRNKIMNYGKSEANINNG